MIDFIFSNESEREIQRKRICILMDISQDESPTMWRQDETRTVAEEATEEDSDGYVGYP